MQPETDLLQDKYKKFLPFNYIQHISEKNIFLENIILYNPNIAFFLSIFLGCLGIDRFYIQDYIIGFSKLLTGGGCGLWWLIDIFIIKKSTKRKNLHNVLKANL